MLIREMVVTISQLKEQLASVPFLSHGILDNLVDTLSAMSARTSVFVGAGSSMNWMAPQRLVSSKWRWYYDTGVPVPASELIWVSVNGSTSQGADAPDTGGYGALRMAVVENTGFWDGEPSSDGKLYVSTLDPEGGPDIVTVIPKGVCVAFARTSEDTVNNFGNVTEGWRPVAMPVGIRLEDMP